MRTTRRALALLAGIAACLGAVAYAAAPPGAVHPAPSPARATASGSLPRPTITQHPNQLATATAARFSFGVRDRNPRFRCRLDNRPWSPCQSPATFTKLAIGSHSFSVRTVGPGGSHSRAARFRWRLLEAKDFLIAPQLANLGALYPGAPPLPLPLTIANPNPVPIFVTDLQVKATADPAGCASAENLALTGSSASRTAPLKVPAGGSISLPAPEATAPTIQLRDLPVNQDACQRTQFPLAFSGTARG
jgi:hypothetical protein